MEQNKKYNSLQKKHKPHTRTVEDYNAPKIGPATAAVKKTNQANQNIPLVRSPQRKDTAAKHRPTKAPFKKNKNSRTYGRNQNKSRPEKRKPVPKKRKKRVWTLTASRESRLHAFLEWAARITKISTLTIDTRPATEKTFSGYKRKGVERPRIPAPIRWLRERLADRIVRPKKKAKSAHRPAALLSKQNLVVKEAHLRGQPQKKLTLTLSDNTATTAKAFKSFTTMLKDYAASTGSAYTRQWKATQTRKIATWYVCNYRPYRQRAQLDIRLFNYTRELRRRKSPTETLALILLSKIKFTQLTQERGNTRVGSAFLNEIARSRRKVYRWLIKQTYPEDSKGLSRALQPLMTAQLNKRASAAEKQLANLLWLFLSPTVGFINPLPLSALRPRALNRRRNLWRKAVPRVHKKGVQDRLFSSIEDKINTICSAARRVYEYSIDEKELYRVERFRLRLRDLRAGRSRDIIGRRKYWRRRPRKPMGKRIRRRVARRRHRRLRRYWRKQNKKMKRTKQTSVKRTTSTKMVTSCKKMNTIFSRFYSTKIYKPEVLVEGKGFTTPARSCTNNKNLKSTRKQGRLKNLKNNARRGTQNALRTVVNRTAKRSSVAFAPKLKKEAGFTKLPPYVLRTKRARKKLKKLGPAKKSLLTSRNRPIIRRFINTRIQIAGGAKLASVRRGAKTQVCAEGLKTGRNFNKAARRLYRNLYGNAGMSAEHYVGWTRSRIRAEKGAALLGHAQGAGKFTQRWQALQRASANKRRAWKALLRQSLSRRVKGVHRRVGRKLLRHARNGRKGGSSRGFRRRSPSAQKRKKMVRHTTRKIRYFIAKKRTLSLKSAKGKQLKHGIKKKSSRGLKILRLPRLLRTKSRRLLTAALAATAHKGLRPSAGNIGGKGLKKRRRERKRFFRLRVKRSVRRRRRRLFKRAVKRARRRRKPAHIKPWLPGPRNRLLIVWTKAAIKKAKLRTGKRRLVVRNLLKITKLPRRYHVKLRIKQRELKKIKGIKKAPRRLKNRLMPVITRLRWIASSVKPQLEKREQLKSKSARTPYLALNYRLRERLRSRRNRRGVTKKEQVGWKTINRLRLAKALKLQRQRRAMNVKQKQQLKPIRTLSVITRAERSRRDIRSLKRNRSKARLKNKRYVSYPATTGVTRQRRIFITTEGAEIKTRGLLHPTAAQMRKEVVKRSEREKIVARVRRGSIKLLMHATALGASLKILNKRAQSDQTKNREVVKTKTHRAANVKARSLLSLRPRLPAAGRTKSTFDALLRKHYNKTIPPKYKRKASKIVTPLAAILPTKKFKSTHQLETQAQLRQSLIVAGNIKNQSFYSVVERRLARVKGTKASGHFGKFGFAKNYSKVEIRAAQAAQYNKTHSMRGIYLGNAETLLQQALTNRRLTRRARKLKILGRKNSRNYAVKTRPFWLKWRHAKKQRRAQIANRYALPQDDRFGRPRVNKWTMNELKLGFSRRQARTPDAYTVQGEALIAPAVARRMYQLEYKLRALAKKKKRLIRANALKRNRRALRVKKKKVHRGIRRLRELFSKFWRHKKRKLKKLKIWKSRKRYRLERRNKRMLRKRFNYRKSMRQAALNTVSSLLERVGSERQKLQSARREAQASQALLTTLHFKKPAGYTVSSAEENKKWQKHIKAVRKQKYRRLAEASEALTTIMPRMISLFLDKPAGAHQTKEQGKRAVRAAYWNLRLFLLQAKRGNAAKLEESYEKLQTVKKELTLWSKDRFFTNNDVKKTRYRFQPYTIMRAPSLHRGADGWLDQFIPQYYDLLLEDPEKYGHFRMTPIQVFRAHPSVAAVRSWETRANPSTMEMQFKRLTNGSYGRSSSRFETMLMTTRRRPTFNGYGAVAESQVVNPAGPAVKKTSFFKRQFSSSSRATVTPTRFLLKARSTALTDNDASFVTLLRPYKNLKERAVAKSRLRQATEFGLESAGGLDPRVVRLKSARSGEFLARLRQDPEVTHKEKTLQRKEYTRNAIATVRGVRRDTRRLVLTSASNTGVLADARAKVAVRRMPTFVHNQKRALEKTFVLTQQARLRGKEYGNTTADVARKVYKATRVNTFRSNMKNVLHYRTPGSVKNKIVQNASPVVPPEAFQLKRHLRNRAYKYGLKTRVKRKLWKNALSRLRNYYLYKMGVWPVSRKNKTKVSFLQIRASKRKSLLPRNFVMTASHQNNLGKFAVRGRGLTHAKVQKKSLQKNFVKSFLELQKARRKINKALQKKLARSNASLWAARRRELWHQLTHKWMKKRRILRRWLKGIKHSFKEKTHWTFEGEHALPEELFKLSRIRLRKLTWRKSDGRFEYKGLKKKLTLRPEERRRNPWLEGMLYTRSLYSTQRMPIRRHQLPKDVKSQKWLQKAKKQLFKKPTTHLYIKKRHWPRLRMYNQRLQRSLFRIRNTKAAVKRFQKLTRRTAKYKVGGDAFMKGTLDRVDANLVLLNFAPTTFWARSMTEMGVVQINGEAVTKKNARLSPGDTLTWNPGTLAVLKEYFDAPLKRWENKKERELVGTVLTFPSNFKYSTKLGYATYLRHPRASDLRLNGRINQYLFKWFRLDSRLGK